MVERVSMTKCCNLLRAGLAEMFGTAILVVIACGTCATIVSKVISMPGLGPSNVMFNPEESAIAAAIKTFSIALAFGLTVMALAAGIGHISGCHVNPAVTVGLLANGRTDPIRAVVYIIAQMVGAVAGAALLTGILPYGAENLCMTGLSTVPKVTAFQGIIIEIIITFLLVFVVCSACDSKQEPILIGLTVTTGHLFAIPLTGSSMNPARYFGPALIQGNWDYHYVYWLGPLIGGALAGLIHRFLFKNKTQTVVRVPSNSEATIKFGAIKANDV